jgi:hypothetical protein
MEEQPIFRCALTVTGTERGEWQGSLETDGKTERFGSVLELLRLIWLRAGPAPAPWPEEQAGKKEETP